MRTCSKCGKQEERRKYEKGTICSDCRRKYAREYRHKNREKTLQYRKDWYEKNREKIVAYFTEYRKKNPALVRAYAADWRKKNKHRIAGYVAKSRFTRCVRASKEYAKKRNHEACAATPEDVEKAFTGKCQNPGCTETDGLRRRRLSMDHCHKTGKFRGWLCGSCNRAAGLLGENLERIEGLAKYIRSSL